MMRLVAIAALASLAATIGCASVVDTDELEPIDDYTDWYRLDVIGPVGGHGDSFRMIYANPVARDYLGSGLHAAGTVLVKEIRFLEDDDQPGDINYIAIMRKLEDPPPGGELDGTGWLFTTQSDVGADELNNERCWRTCHQGATLDGTFLNWSSSAAE